MSGKPITYGKVQLENNELSQEQDGIKSSAGKVDFTGVLKRDVNKNLVTAEGVQLLNGSQGNTVHAESAIIDKAHNNVVTGKNSTVKNANGCTVDATDTDVSYGGNYSGCSGDAHDISGYSSRTDGYQNKNHIDGGIAQGTNIKLGDASQPNKFSQSGGVGATMSVQGSKIWVYGNAGGKEFTEEGTYLCCNGHILALKPDGSVWLNDAKLF
jgi:hypothetical protein